MGENPLDKIFREAAENIPVEEPSSAGWIELSKSVKAFGSNGSAGFLRFGTGKFTALLLIIAITSSALYMSTSADEKELAANEEVESNSKLEVQAGNRAEAIEEENAFIGTNSSYTNEKLSTYSQQEDNNEAHVNFSALIESVESASDKNQEEHQQGTTRNSSLIGKNIQVNGETAGLSARESERISTSFDLQADGKSQGKDAARARLENLENRTSRSRTQSDHTSENSTWSGNSASAQTRSIRVNRGSRNGSNTVVSKPHSMDFYIPSIPSAIEPRRENGPWLQPSPQRKPSVAVNDGDVPYKKSRFSIIPYASVDHSIVNLNTDIRYLASSRILEEDRGLAYSLGARLRWNLNTRFNVDAGFYYVDKGTIAGILGVAEDPVHSNFTIEAEFLELPIMLSYRLPFRGFGISLGAGSHFRKNTASDKSVINEFDQVSGTFYSINTNNSSVGLGLVSTLGLDIKLSPRVSLLLEPSYRYGLDDLVLISGNDGYNLPLNPSVHSFSLGTGLIMQLK